MGDEQEQLLDVFDNAGLRGQMPAKNAEEAFGKRGFKYAMQDDSGAWKPTQAVKVTDNLGRPGWMPSTHVQQAIKERGFTVGQPMQAAGDKVENGKFVAGNPQPSSIGEGGIDPFLMEAAPRVGDAFKSMARTTKVGGKTMLKMAADPTPGGITRALAEEAAEEQQSGGIPRSKDIVMQPLRELAGERQPGESATLGFTGHDPSQQPLLSRTGTALSSLMGGDPASARRHFDLASTLNGQGNPDEAGRENQRGSADLTAVPAATVGLGRLLGSRGVQDTIREGATDVAHSASGTLDTLAHVGDQLPFPRLPRAIGEARTSIAKAVVKPLVRKPVGAVMEDARFGRDPAQALADEGLSGTKTGILDKAQKRVGELADAVDGTLQNHANAGAQIDAEPIINQAIDNAITAARKTGNQGTMTRLQNLRDALLQEYGPTKGTPFEINNLKRQVGEAASDLGAFRSTDPIEASAASAMQDVYKGLKNAVNEQVPEVAPLNDRIANLMSARTALRRNIALEGNQSMLSGMSMTNAPFKIADKTISSAPVRSGVMRLINMGNTLDVPEIAPRAKMGRLPAETGAPAPLPRPVQSEPEILPPARRAEDLPSTPQRRSGESPTAPTLPRLDPASTQAARLSMLRNELIKTTDRAERANIQQAIDYEVAHVTQSPWTQPDQATAENLPQPDMTPRPGPPPVKTTAVSRVNPGEHGIVDPRELQTDPARFQFKGGTNEQGVTNALKDTKKYDPNKGGVLLIWEDPANKKSYVVNGHHRYELATRTGEPAVAVRKIQADTAEKARAIGAEVNISEGHGTGVDAARYFKDYGITTPEAAAARDLPLGQSKVQDGLALARLDDSILDKIESGEVPEARGVAIGAITENPAQQEAVLQAIQKLESKGKSVTVGQVESLARQVRETATHVEEGQDLFGSFAREHSLFGEQSEIDDFIQRQLRNDKRTFGAVASKSRPEPLGKVKGQQIVPEENQAISREAAQAEELYNKLVNRAGRLHDIRADAAKQLSNGYKTPREVKAQAYESIRQELKKEMPSDGR
jgi:hypothetical protein